MITTTSNLFLYVKTTKNTWMQIAKDGKIEKSQNWHMTCNNMSYYVSVIHNNKKLLCNALCPSLDLNFNFDAYKILFLNCLRPDK